MLAIAQNSQMNWIFILEIAMKESFYLSKAAIN